MADFDLAGTVESIVGKAAGDNDLLKQINEEPAKAIENMTGIDIPDEQIDAVVKKLGGIEGLVADYTKKDGGGVQGVVDAAEAAVSSEVSDNVGSAIGSLFGGDGK